MDNSDNNKRAFSYYIIACIILVYTLFFGISGIVVIFSGWVSDFKMIFGDYFCEVTDNTRNSIFLCLYIRSTSRWVYIKHHFFPSEHCKIQVCGCGPYLGISNGSAAICNYWDINFLSNSRGVDCVYSR